MKNKIALAPVAKILKEHANMDIATSTIPGHATKVSKYAAITLQDHLEEYAHEISENASQTAFQDGRRTIKPEDVITSIDQEIDPELKTPVEDFVLYQIKVKDNKGTIRTGRIEYTPSWDIARVFNPFNAYVTFSHWNKQYAGPDLYDVLWKLHQRFEIIESIPPLPEYTPEKLKGLTERDICSV